MPFYVHERESLTYDYERNPNDPRAAHDFTIEVDAWGNVRKSCQVFYPRRGGLSPLSDNPASPDFQTAIRLASTRLIWPAPIPNVRSAAA